MMRTVLIAAAVAFASPALAETAPDAATLGAARELMQVTDVPGQMRALGPRMAEGIGQQMRLMFKDDAMPEGLRDELTAAMQAYIGSMDSYFTPAFIDQLAAIYARHFTVDELRRVTAFMKEPVMVKFREETPALMAEMLPLTFEAMKPGQQQFMEKIKQIVADWIARHPEDKAKLRSPTAS
nr:DUF2059 domain-containing protein [Sphingomonas sp. Y57]